MNQNLSNTVIQSATAAIEQDPSAKIDNDQQVYLDYTVDHMLSHIRLLEDHFLDIATDRNVLQCFACSYWHLYSLISYDSLERPKFDPNYDTRFLKWLEKTTEEVQSREMTRDRARELVKELREWRYYFVGEEDANIPGVELHQVELPGLDLRIAAMYGYSTDMHSPYKTVEDLEAVIAAKERALADDPARKLVKYIKRSGNMKTQFVDLTQKQFRDLTGKNANPAVISKKTGRIPWEYVLDMIAPEYDYSPEDLKDAVERCHRTIKEIDDLKHDLKIAREKDPDRPSCTRLVNSEDVCNREIFGDACKSKSIHCGDEEMLAIRNPSSWSIHIVRDGQIPGESTSVGDVRYAAEASSAIKDLASALSMNNDAEQRDNEETLHGPPPFALAPELAAFYNLLI